MIKREITIYDIANELSVSASTVSRALRDHCSIGEKTKKRIKAFASENGYRPYAVTANLYRKKMYAIGVIVPGITSPMVSSMISGIEQVANRNGFNVIIAQSHDKLKIETKAAKAFLEARIDGLIVSLASEAKDTEHFQDFIANNIPIICFNNIGEANHAGEAITTKGYFETLHLVDKGCKRIAFVGEIFPGGFRSEKFEGFLKVLTARNIAVDENLIVINKQLTIKTGFEAASYLLNLDAPPDAIFIENDAGLGGVIQYAKRRGIKIPQELVVVGSNDDFGAVDFSTSVISPAEELGARAALEILNRDCLSSMDGMKKLSLK